MKKEVVCVSVGSKEVDNTDEKAVNHYIKKLKPTIIYHCAAYTGVDAAEDEGKELNQFVNVCGTENVAKATEEVSARLVYISTDYVFDGTNLGEYKETDPTNPKSEYGRAKLAGEQAVQKLVSKHYIVRTSWVFVEYGKNFVFTMQRLVETHPKLTVVADQVGRPTWTRTLAEFVYYLTEQKAEYPQKANRPKHSVMDLSKAKEIGFEIPT